MTLGGRGYWFGDFSEKNGEGEGWCVLLCDGWLPVPMVVVVSVVVKWWIIAAASVVVSPVVSAHAATVRVVRNILTIVVVAEARIVACIARITVAARLVVAILTVAIRVVVLIAVPVVVA